MSFGAPEAARGIDGDPTKGEGRSFEAGRAVSSSAQLRRGDFVCLLQESDERRSRVDLHRASWSGRCGTPAACGGGRGGRKPIIWSAAGHLRRASSARSPPLRSRALTLAPAPAYPEVSGPARGLAPLEICLSTHLLVAMAGERVASAVGRDHGRRAPPGECGRSQYAMWRLLGSQPPSTGVFLAAHCSAAGPPRLQWKPTGPTY
ncbi:unnamed protein product [Urochloa humidicola]